MQNSTQLKTSDFPSFTTVMYQQPDGTFLTAISPEPPTAQAIARAQPFRADTLNKMEAIIKNPSYQITG
jgi:hypothetical protein